MDTKKRGSPQGASKTTAARKSKALKSTAQRSTPRKGTAQRSTPRKGTVQRSTAQRSTAHKGTGVQKGKSPSELIDARIKELGDWRGDMLSRLRALVKEADPEVIEEWKWRGVPVWSHAGLICTGETYKSVVKMTFAKGAALKDPSRLFNSSLDGNTRRAIDFHDGQDIDEKALKALLRDAVALNQSKGKS